MKLEFHAIQAFAASNLNRDDTGSPKSTVFGGFRRSRISSQCTKRAARQFVREHLQANQVDAAELAGLGVRTSRLRDLIVQRHKEDLAAHWPKGASEEEAFAEGARGRVGILLRAAGAALDDQGRTKALIYVGDQEIAMLARTLDDHWDQLDPKTALAPKGSKDAAAEEAAGDGGEVDGASAGDDQAAGTALGSAATEKKTAKGAKGKSADLVLTKSVLAGLRAPLKAAFSHRSMDIALFGRFMADRADLIVDAACQVAHAVGVSKLELESDYFTAVDDLGDTGAAQHLGATEFTAPTLYRYAVVDTDLLLKNLNGDEALARRAIALFFEAFAVSVPTGKQNSFAAHNMPGFVGVVARSKGPMSLANAFEKPLRARPDASLSEQAVAALVKEDEWTAAVYGMPDRDRWCFVDKTEQWQRGERAASVASLASWAAHEAYDTVQAPALATSA